MKLMRGTPISTRQQFSAGGNMVPIVTKASAQSVAGVQQMGTSVGTTKLGAYRMGDADGNAPGSAIYPDDIFSPLPNRPRKYADVTFESVGNRVFQPPGDDMKLHSLLKKFGDQKFKAEQSAPFEEYFRIQRLVRETDQMSRSGGLEELGASREIIRNLADTRRQGNEDDFMRRMLDAGMSMEDAQDEIDNVRRASALQESRTVDDRHYQSKLLISRIAQSRGGVSQVKDPLSQSAAISNPQNSQDAHLAMGMKDEGFGTNPIDVNRQFMTADFYRKFGRKMPQSQEAQDSMAAVNYLISQGTAGNVTNVSQVKGLERAEAIQRQREFAASKLETLRNRGTKIVLPLAPFVFSDSLLRQVYGKREPGDTTYFTEEDSQTLTNTQAIVAMNQLLALDSNGSTYKVAHEFLRKYPIMRRDGTPSPDIFEITRALVAELTDGKSISLPFVGKTLSFSSDSGNTMELAKALDSIKTLNASSGSARLSARAYAEAYDRQFENPRGAGPPAPEATRLASGATAVPEVVVGSTAVADLIPGAPGVASAIAGLRKVEAETAARNAGRRRETAVAGLRKVEAETAARNVVRRRETAVAGLRQVEVDTRARNLERRVAGIPSSEELAALPKKELIRIGNDVQVAVYGTKNDIIARIESRRR
jgi:hypothetical protein